MINETTKKELLEKMNYISEQRCKIEKYTTALMYITDSVTIYTKDELQKAFLKIIKDVCSKLDDVASDVVFVFNKDDVIRFISNLKTDKEVKNDN